MAVKTKEDDCCSCCSCCGFCSCCCRKGPPYPWRMVFLFLTACGFAITSALNVNMHSILLSMIDRKTLWQNMPDNDGAKTTTPDSRGFPPLDFVGIRHCDYNNFQNYENKVPPDFVNSTCCVKGQSGEPERLRTGCYAWNEWIHGSIISSYYWGYVMSALPAMYLSEVLSAKYVFGVGVCSNAILCILTPSAAKSHYGSLVVCRFLQGLCAGVAFPTIGVMFGRWSAPFEGLDMYSTVYVGGLAGIMGSLPFCGTFSYAFGWSMVFYGMGAISLIWCIFWFCLVSDHPTHHKYISYVERECIIEAIEEADLEIIPVPWYRVSRCVPYYVCCITLFCCNAGLLLMVTELPTYLVTIQLVGIRDQSFASAFPFLAMWAFSMVLTPLAECVVRRRWLSTGVIQRVSTVLACVLPACCWIGVAQARCNFAVVMTLLVVGTGAMGGMVTGHWVNPIRLAPDYAGPLMTVANTVGALPGIIVPLIVGGRTYRNHTLNAWNPVFYGVATVQLLGAVVYVAFSRSEVQPWSRIYELLYNSDDSDDEHEDCDDTQKVVKKSGDDELVLRCTSS